MANRYQVVGRRARCRDCRREWRVPTIRELEAIAGEHVRETGHRVTLTITRKKELRRA